MPAGAALFALLLTACSSPFWRFDRIVVEGSFNGDSCSYRYSGRGLDTDDTLHVEGKPYVALNGYPTGPWDFTDIGCERLVIGLTRPRPSEVRPGHYRIPDHDAGPGPALNTVTLGSPAIAAGGWPALARPYAVATHGEVVFDTLTSTRAVGRFRFVMWRQARGP